MSITRFTGPIVVSGEGPTLPGYNVYNDTAGPSAFAHGTGILDTRFGPFNGGDVSNIIPFWYGVDSICVIDQVPSAISATNIAAAQAGAVGNMTLVSTSGGGITVGAQNINALTNQIVTGWAIDNSQAYIQVNTAPIGVGGGMSAYDPRTMIARAVRITSAGNDSGATATVSGLDVYGYPIHQTITLANAGVVTTAKTFKMILTVTLAGALSGSNVSVGTSDIYGFPLAGYEWAFVDIFWNQAFITVNTGYTAPVTTNPATYLTGDVRGTYAVQSASDGTKKLQIFVTPQAWNNTSATLFGVAQV
jgi:hypothetical protein